MHIIHHGSNANCPSVLDGTHSHCPTHEVKDEPLHFHGELNRIEAYKRLACWIEKEKIEGPIAILIKLLQRDEGMEIKP